MNFTILRFDSINSTNTEAINQAKRGADEGLCVVAKQQTAGRGRQGRTWVSPENTGLYFSIVLRPILEMQFLPLLTLMSAVTVFETLKETYKIQPDIKWANDVHVNDKKISGILAESTETNKGLAVIVGIGINLNSKNFPPELEEIATSIETETNEKPNVNELLENLTKQFSKFYKIIQSENGTEKICKEWIQRSSYAFGKDVCVNLANETIFGTTSGIEKNGALRVETENGEIKTIHAGDVEKLRKNI
jgi:BirA family biotin operon repressor/biotin-[acetyl-CoA-carboxylase] ligase